MLDMGIRTDNAVSDIDGFVLGHSLYALDAGLSLIGNKNQGSWQYALKLNKTFFKDYRFRALYNLATNEYDFNLGMFLFKKYRLDIGYGSDGARASGSIPITESIRWYGAARQNLDNYGRGGFEASTGLSITFTTGSPQYAEQINRKEIRWLD